MGWVANLASEVGSWFTGVDLYDEAGNDSSDDDVLGTLSGYLSSVGEQNSMDREYNSAEALAQREWQEKMYAEQKAFNSAEALKERLWNSNEAELSRKWQSDMSNTSYQRAVADLKAAGLNPILAAARSAGASTGSGGLATGGSAASISSTTGSSAHSQGSRGVDLTQIINSIAALMSGSADLLEAFNIFKSSGSKNRIGF